MKNKLLILLSSVLLISCSEEQEQVILTEATYVVFYSDNNIDTLNVSTYNKIVESSYRGVNNIYISSFYKNEDIYNNTAPFKRIKFKQTIIK